MSVLTWSWWKGFKAHSENPEGPRGLWQQEGFVSGKCQVRICECFPWTSLCHVHENLPGAIGLLPKGSSWKGSLKPAPVMESRPHLLGTIPSASLGAKAASCPSIHCTLIPQQ